MALGELAMKDGERAIRLIKRMRPGDHERPVGEVIRALAEAGSVDDGTHTAEFLPPACYRLADLGAVRWRASQPTDFMMGTST